MDFAYEAERLNLQVLDEGSAMKLLAFVEENADIFMQYEQKYPENYFTVEYQELLLKGWLNQFLNQTGIRYFVFEKDKPDVIVGCVGLSDVNLSDRSAKVYYKLDKMHYHKGYATEAVSCLLWHAAEELGMHRIEADILPENEKSKGVVKRLGFQLEGVAIQSHSICGEWKDHERYALIL